MVNDTLILNVIRKENWLQKFLENLGDTSLLLVNGDDEIMMSIHCHNNHPSAKSHGFWIRLKGFSTNTFSHLINAPEIVMFQSVDQKIIYLEN